MSRIATPLQLSAPTLVQWWSETLSQSLAPVARDAETEAAERSLSEFVRQAWTVVVPGRRFQPNWHIDAICEHLEGVSGGEIRNLVINMPPRSLKSNLVAVMWPAWEWLTRPELQYLFSSYRLPLATRDSVACRRLMQSPWYQARWGDRFQMLDDQNQKMRFENDRRGHRVVIPIGAGTGEGGDRIVVDDPHNTEQAESATQRDAAVAWWDESMSTRGNDPETVARVVVMQRLHDRDLTGHLEDQGGYVHLKLPMEYEGQRYVSGWGPEGIPIEDPRSVDGELLHPERFTPTAVAEMKLRLGSYGAAGQLQQRPRPREGGMFKRPWLSIVPTSPTVAQRVRYWDKAGTAGGGDYSAGVLMAMAGGRFSVEDVVRGQWSSGERNAVMQQTAALDRQRYGTVATWVEQEPGSGGKESAENTKRQLAGFSIRSETVTGAKETRADPFAAQCEAGNVSLVEGPWNREYLDELTAFPNGRNDDQVDGSSGAFNKLAGKRSIQSY